MDYVFSISMRSRIRLNNLQLSEIQERGIIEEAKNVFALNQSLFEELEGSWIRALANCLPSIFKRSQRA
jgi:heme oxygenase